MAAGERPLFACGISNASRMYAIPRFAGRLIERGKLVVTYDQTLNRVTVTLDHEPRQMLPQGDWLSAVRLA